MKTAQISAVNMINSHQLHFQKHVCVPPGVGDEGVGFFGAACAVFFVFFVILILCCRPHGKLGNVSRGPKGINRRARACAEVNAAAIHCIYLEYPSQRFRRLGSLHGTAPQPQLRIHRNYQASTHASPGRQIVDVCA